MRSMETCCICLTSGIAPLEGRFAGGLKRVAQTLEAPHRQLTMRLGVSDFHLPFPSLALSDCLLIRALRIGAQEVSGQWGPDGDAAVRDSRAVPASPVVSVHASVLKPDVADAGRIVGECV